MKRKKRYVMRGLTLADYGMREMIGYIKAERMLFKKVKRRGGRGLAGSLR